MPKCGTIMKPYKIALADQAKRVAGTEPITTQYYARSQKINNLRLIHCRRKHHYHEPQSNTTLSFRSITTYMMPKWGTIIKPYKIALANQAKRVAGTEPYRNTILCMVTKDK